MTRDNWPCVVAPGGILALDLATCTGWAYALPGGQPIWGARRNGGTKGACVGIVGLDFMTWLEEQCDTLRPRWIFYERPFITPKLINPEVVLRLYGLEMLTLIVAERHDIPAESVPTAKMMRFFAGFASWGNRAEKKAASIRMAELYGWKVESDDEADALGLLMYGEARVAPRVKRTAGSLFINA